MRIPSHTSVAAYAALFVALGGTSYAALKLPANSITTREIKPRSVRLSDLASSARPPSKARMAQAVTEVINDPASGIVNIKVTGEKGDKGDQGAIGAGVEGPQGEAGPQGPRGQALGFAHVSSGGARDDERSSANAVVSKPDGTSGMYCVKATDATVRNVYVTLDADDPGTVNSQNDRAFARIPPDDTKCVGYDFEVIVMRDIGSGTIVAANHGLFLTLN